MSMARAEDKNLLTSAASSSVSSSDLLGAFTLKTTVYTTVLNLIQGVTYNYSVFWNAGASVSSDWSAVMSNGLFNIAGSSEGASSGSGQFIATVGGEQTVTLTTSSTWYDSVAGVIPASFTTATVSGAFASSLSTPGPLAGVGLPMVLGLMGFAAYRRRMARAA